MSDYQVSYGADSAEELIVKPLKPGKHEHVKITEIVKEKVGASNIPTLTFKFSLPENKTFTHREFPVNPENIVKNISKFGGKSAQEVIAQETRRTTASILHIFSAFVPQDKIIIGKVESWEQYIDKMIDIAGTSYEGQEFRFKVLYAKNGFLSFPKSVINPWFQNMEVADTITINKYDMKGMTPPAPTQEMNLDAPVLDDNVEIKEDDLEF